MHLAFKAYRVIIAVNPAFFRADAESVALPGKIRLSTLATAHKLYSLFSVVMFNTFRK